LPVYQIGTDGGLLASPIDMTNQPLILSPAERADLLIDFSQHANKHIVMINTAIAPFANNFIQNPIAQLNNHCFDPATDENRNPYPQVMKFKVNEAVAEPQPYDFNALTARFEMLKATGTSSFSVDQAKLNSPTQTRTIAIIEKSMGIDQPPMLVLWELLRPDELQGNDPVLGSKKQITIDGVLFYVVAERFQDPVSYMVEYGTAEQWRFINLTADTHPMHMHLVQFIAKSRVKIATINNQDVANGEEIKTAVSDALGNVTIVRGVELPLDANEKGFKDTIRVNPTEIVEIDAKFDGYMGRYVYHCHLLEHEDHDMMRQFIVTRDDVKHEGSPVSVGA